MSRSKSACSRAERGHVQLVVQLQRAIVEIGRAEDAQQAIDDHRLGVHHGRLVFVELDTLFQQALVGGAAREFHRLGVGDVAFDDHPDSDAAPARVGEAPFGRFIHDEVRRLDVERGPSGGDRQQVEQLHPARAAFRPAPHDNGPRAPCRCVVVREEIRFDDLAALDPILIERPFDVHGGRAADLDLGVAPARLRPGIHRPLVRDADAADERDIAVDDERLPMGAVIQLLEGEAGEPVGPGDPAACALEALDVVPLDGIGADRIQDQPDVDAAPRRGFKRRGETVRDLSAVVDIRFEAHAVTRPADRLQHGRQCPGALAVHDVRVPGRQRRAEQAGQVLRELRIAGGERRSDPQCLLVLRDQQGAGDDERRDEEGAENVPGSRYGDAHGRSDQPPACAGGS